MKPPEFEIGKVYEAGKTWTTPRLVLARYSEVQLVILRSLNHIGETRDVDGPFGGMYEEIPISELSAKEMTIYLQYFPDAGGCTCDSRDLMLQGCKCGAFQKERA